MGKANDEHFLDTPRWVTTVVEEFVGHFCPSESDKLPEVRCFSTEGNEYRSEGHWRSKDRIDITLGISVFDQYFVLLHELTHWKLDVLGLDHEGRHDKRFYEAAAETYEYFGIPFEYAIEREEVVPVEWATKSRIHK